MTSIESVHHVAVRVTDVARARRFYAEVLGLEEIDRPGFDFPGAWFRVGVQQIHLIADPTPASSADTHPIDTRARHMALRVTSYRDTLAHLQAQSISCVARPQNKTPWPQIYLTDPDGNVIELNAERLDTDTQ